MFLKIKRLTPLMLASSGAVALSKDIKTTAQNNDEIDTRTYDKSTGWERVKSLFVMNDRGELSPDGVMITSSVGFGILAGVAVAAVTKSRQTLQDFMEKNDASKFQNITEARRELARLLTKEMLNGVFQYAPTFAFLAGGYTLVSTSFAAYRGKTGMLEHLVAGSVIGTLYRFNFGFRGMLVGFTTGSIFGAVYGLSTYLLLTITGTDLEQSRKEFHNLYYYSDRKFKRKMAELENQEELSGFELAKAERLRDLPLTLDQLEGTARDAA